MTHPSATPRDDAVSGQARPPLGWVASWLVLVIATVLATPAAAQPASLSGQVIDALTETPIAGATVRVGDHVAATDEYGDYWLELPGGSYVIEVYAELPDGTSEAVRQTDQYAPPASHEQRDIYLMTGAFLDRFPLVEGAIGVPEHRYRVPPPDGDPVDLLELWASRLPDDAPSLGELPRIELPDVLPDSIRVGRRFTGNCADAEVTRIDTVDLDTYAAGVVTAEIGVFRALTTGEESQRDSFRAFAIAARAYALWFYARDPDAAYHLDDTACNQRYIDGPYPDIIVESAQQTAGQYLVQAGTTHTIDKFEYASSCGRHGTLPEYTEEIIPDLTGENACTTGGWCGHNNCAGHQVNPDFPDDGRCLVRGICQWGTAERSARGDTHEAILTHYQPYLQIAPDTTTPQLTRVLGFVREGTIESGPGVVGAQVTLDTGESARTGEDGLYVIHEVAEAGTRSFSVSAPGYEPATLEVALTAQVDNWVNVALTRSDTPADPDPAQDAGAPDATADPDPPTDTGTDSGSPDTGVADAGGIDTGSGGGPDAGSVGGPDGQIPSESPFPRFAQVGSEGLDQGCQTATRPTVIDLSPWIVLALLAAPAFRRRGRRFGR